MVQEEAIQIERSRRGTDMPGDGPPDATEVMKHGLNLAVDRARVEIGMYHRVEGGSGYARIDPDERGAVVDDGPGQAAKGEEVLVGIGFDHTGNGGEIDGPNTLQGRTSSLLP